MKKTLLIAAALVCAGAFASAEEPTLSNTMNVYKTEPGVTENVALNRIAKITFGTGVMNVTLDDATVLNINLSEVSKINFTTSLSVEGVTAETTAPRLSHVRGTSTLTVTGVAEGATAAVYDLSGRLMLSAVINGDDIDVSRLADGQVYVFVTEGMAAKFIK